MTGIYDFVVIIKGNGPGRCVTVNMNSELTQWLEENLEKNDLLLTPESVSYTHLDVYKRQAFPCPYSVRILHTLLKSSGESDDW